MLISPTKISKTKQGSISRMIEMKFSNSQIARALKIDDQTVKNYRNGDKNVKKTIGPKKTTGTQKRVRDPSEDPDQDRRSDLEHQDPDPANNGDTQGSTGDPGSKGIEFIGGNKTMVDNKESTEKDYECPGCGVEFNGKPKFCPNCGKELDWD